MRVGLLLALLIATPAFAQSDNRGENDDSLTIGLGVASIPRYEGADDNTLNPAGALRGSLGGIAFTTVGPALYVDLIPRRGQTGGKFVLGPVVHATLNRTSNRRTRDPQIIALGKPDVAIEVGAQVGYSINGLITSDFDNLALNVAAYQDVTGTHRGLNVVPSISYGTPLSTSTFVGISASATYVTRDYGETYFGVTPAQSVASGLPTYRPDKGFKDFTLGSVGALSLSGDLRRGLSLFAIGSYSKLVGDYKRSPVVRNADQWFGSLGLAYTF